MIRRRERQLRIVDREIAAFEIEQATRATEIVQQMAIDMKEISIVTDASNDVLLPDFSQQGPAALFHQHILPLTSVATAFAVVRRLARLDIQGRP
ncbi:hypothetical protein GALL_531950 [mine drainage metagenome]|uniref:Uncharacterized protein n=1 Tax=mine drainage metagenome TaxID=410659 RepID=A0A1J5P2F8_9ZZZZ